MATNGISTLGTKELRQKAKLDIAELKRKGYSTIVQNTTAYSAGGGVFSFGQIKITVNNVDDVYLHFYDSVPAISNQLKVGMIVTIDWDGRAPNTVAYIASTLIDFPGHAWQPQGLGFLLTIITTTELPGNSEDYNIDALHVPNGTFAGSGSPDTTAVFYRVNNTYDLAQLPTQYSGDAVVDNANTGGILDSRPWNPDTIITVIEEGLILNLDARNLNSWSREPGEDMWYDLSGNDNHATVYGGIAYGEALGGALAFDGSNEQYAQCVPGVYFTSAGYTIQSWVYIISIPNWNRIIDFGSDAGSDNVLLSATAELSGFPVLWVGPSGSNAQSTVQLLPNTGWHHVCATWTPTGTVGKVFIDGVMTGTASIPAPTSGVRANCYIGRSNWGFPPGGPDPNFNGGMGAIQIYSRALSDAEILSNYNTTKSYYGL
jgi:hypothetical protein